jgi:hypothetical protein
MGLQELNGFATDELCSILVLYSHFVLQFSLNTLGASDYLYMMSGIPFQQQCLSSLENIKKCLMVFVVSAARVIAFQAFVILLDFLAIGDDTSQQSRLSSYSGGPPIQRSVSDHSEDVRVIRGADKSSARPPIELAFEARLEARLYELPERAEHPLEL